MMLNEALLDDEPMEFKGTTLVIMGEEDDCTDDDADERSCLNRKNEPNSSTLVLPCVKEDPNSYFCSREESVSNVIMDVKTVIDKLHPTEEIIGIWLLTEISFWDNERERVAVLTKNFLIIIKYDFIAMKILHHQEVNLRNVDTLSVGDLVYPTGSLAPHLNGFTSGIVQVIRNCTTNISRSSLPNLHLQSKFNDIFNNFRARSRNTTGIRVMWNKGEPLKFSTRWNPFTNNIPWATFASHPLLWHKDPEEEPSRIYDVDNFASRLIKIVQQTPRSSLCQVQHQPILLHNYFGILSIIHNRNALGFFKIRGKFSF